MWNKYNRWFWFGYNGDFQQWPFAKLFSLGIENRQKSYFFIMPQILWWSFMLWFYESPPKETYKFKITFEITRSNDYVKWLWGFGPYKGKSYEEVIGSARRIK